MEDKFFSTDSLSTNSPNASWNVHNWFQKCISFEGNLMQQVIISSYKIKYLTNAALNLGSYSTLLSVLYPLVIYSSSLSFLKPFYETKRLTARWNKI